MLGRGILERPDLLGQIRRRERKSEEGEEGFLDIEKLRRFHDRLYEDYRALGMGDKNVLFKMKEIWCYLGKSFPEKEKVLKKIRKAERLEKYEAAVEELL